MWFGPPYFFAEPITVGATNPEATAQWYQQVFSIKRLPVREDDEIDLGTYDGEERVPAVTVGAS